MSENWSLNCSALLHQHSHDAKSINKEIYKEVNLFLYLTTMWRSIASLIPCCFTPRERNPLNWRHFWEKWLLPPAGIQACQIVQPVAYSLYWICYSNSSNREMSVSKSFQNLLSMLETKVCSVHWSNRQWYLADRPFA